MALGALAAFAVVGVVGGPAAGLFKAQNAFQDPHSDSARAEALLKRLTGTEIGPGVLVLVAAPPRSAAVRALLVPSLMVLLGRRNWWSPPALTRLHDHLPLKQA
jgi:hypothetical protein